MRGTWCMVTALLLAGCGGDADPADGDGAITAADTSAIEAPTWAVGDWWTYQIGDRQVTWVVTEDLGQSWMLDIDDADWAFDHAAFAQTSTLGEVSKDHLAGSQEAGPVRFFDFPLRENKTWTMTWDGIAFDVEVVDVAGQTAEIRAESTDGALRVYIYDAAIGWFRTIYAERNGTPEFEARVTANGHAYSGQYVRWEIHEQVQVHTVPGGLTLRNFNVPDGTTDIWYFVHIVCLPDGLEGDQGAYIFEVHPRDSQQGMSVRGVCPEPFVEGGTLPAVVDDWGITSSSLGGTIDALLIPRTLHELRL